MSRKTPKFEALVVNAIRRLQAAQGSTASEIASYLSQEYDVSGPEIRRQIQLTIRRGLNYGILQKSKRGYTTCDRNVPDVDPLEEDCIECRVRRRRGGDRLKSRRARSRRRGGGGYRALANARTAANGRQKRIKRMAPRRVRRTAGVTRKARSGRGYAARQTNRRPNNNFDKAKQKKQAPPEEPPDNASTTSTNNNDNTNRGRTSSSKSPIRKESETNQES